MAISIYFCFLNKEEIKKSMKRVKFNYKKDERVYSRKESIASRFLGSTTSMFRRNSNFESSKTDENLKTVDEVDDAFVSNLTENRFSACLKKHPNLSATGMKT